jgi:hypothetical protein
MAERISVSRAFSSPAAGSAPRRGRARPLLLLEIGHRRGFSLPQLRQQVRTRLGPGRRPVEVFQHLGIQDAARPSARAQGLEILGDDPPLMDRDLRRVSADVRRHDHIGKGQQRVVRRGRLHGEDVQGGAAEMPRAQRLDQGVLIDEGRPGGVDEEASGPHPRELPLADDPGRIVGDRRVQRDEIARREQRIERCGLGAGEAHGIRIDVGVAHEAVHTEREQSFDDLAADGSHAHEADGLVPELAPLEAAEGPSHAAHVAGLAAGLPQEGRGFGHAPGEHQEKRQRQVRDGVGVAARGVQHGDP